MHDETDAISSYATCVAVEESSFVSVCCHHGRPVSVAVEWASNGSSYAMPDLPTVVLEDGYEKLGLLRTGVH